VSRRFNRVKAHRRVRSEPTCSVERRPKRPIASDDQWRSKGMTTNCAYAGGVNCAKVVFSSYDKNRNISIILFEIRRRCLFVHTTYGFNDVIMKIT
jgi:hypothetical protein